MKKLLSMVLLTVLCIGLCVGTAHADILSQLVGYWEVQNIGLGGYAFGPKHVGVDEMTAVVEEDVVARCADICDGQEIVAEEVAVLGLETERVKVGSDLGIGGTCNGFDIGLLKDDA